MVRQGRSGTPRGRLSGVLGGAAVAAVVAVLAVQGARAADPTAGEAEAAASAATQRTLSQYCSGCHNDAARVGGFSVQNLKASDFDHGLNTEAWEKILRRLSLGEMPPKGMPRPTPDQLNAMTHWMGGSLDAYAAAHPNPGRATLRRMNRAEYANAVRDLLAYDVDVSRELPADDAGYGFDNISDVLSVSPTLMDRYIAVAGRISRTAAGLASDKPFVTIYNVPKDGSLKNLGVPAFNERANDALPLDSRGGAAFRYYAPHDGVYEVRAYLNANTNTELDRLAEHLVGVKVPMTAGVHTVGMSFQKELALDELPQTLLNTTSVIIMPSEPPRPLQLNVQVDGVRVGRLSVPSYDIGPRYSQANYLRDIQQMEIEGPFAVTGPGDTASRRRIFICRPGRSLSEDACARRIIASLARQAYRRPVTGADVAPLMKVYAAARADSDFDHGVEAAVQAVLVSPKFLFLQEKDPETAKPGSVRRLTDLELASRLSFFLWSSIPDAELLAVAEQGRLKTPAVLEKQVTRMLADRRAEALTNNFAAQWLYLRNLEYQRPDIVDYPAFDTRLRQAMKQETEMFFASIVRDNRSVLDFIDADYTYLNQRLAEHYGVPGVYGASFRRVKLDPASQRGGLLGQGSILTVTSYGNRTSVVRRGKWILDSLLLSSPPPPPPNIPALVESRNGKVLTAREQMEMHRSNPSCSMCHAKMDPLGFSLENYDAVGAWRVADASGKAVDAAAVMADGTAFTGPAGLKGVLLSRKDQFAQAFTDRLLTYALARGLEAPDMPVVRAVSRQAAADNYRIHAIILGIVKSEPFSMRKVPEK